MFYIVYWQSFCHILIECKLLILNEKKVRFETFLLVVLFQVNKLNDQFLLFFLLLEILVKVDIVRNQLMILYASWDMLNLNNLKKNWGNKSANYTRSLQA